MNDNFGILTQISLKFVPCGAAVSKSNKHWLRWRLGTEISTSHDLNQICPIPLKHIYIARPCSAKYERRLAKQLNWLYEYCSNNHMIVNETMANVMCFGRITEISGWVTTAFLCNRSVSINTLAIFWNQKQNQDYLPVITIIRATSHSGWYTAFHKRSREPVQYLLRLCFIYSARWCVLS